MQPVSNFVRTMFLMLLLTGTVPPGLAGGAEPTAPSGTGAPGVTSLTSASVRYTVSEQPYVVLSRGGVQAVIVGNAAVDVPSARLMACAMTCPQAYNAR